MRPALLGWVLISMTVQAAVVLTRTPDRIHIEIDGQPFSDFYYGPEAPKPYLHPLRSADGKIVTRHFPMEKVEGETTTDQHHRCLWLGFKSVNGFNFWENEFSYNRKDAGKAVTKSIDAVQSGDHMGVIAATIQWLSPAGEPLLEERRRMTIAAEGKLRIVDVDVTLKALVDTTFADSKDGAFSVRVAEAMAERNGGLIVNSEGGRAMAQTWGKPAKWLDYSGEVEGEKVGIAIFEHPSSFHYPSRWHVRDYGLLAVNPFGWNAFDSSLPVRPTILNAGKAIHLRYRVVVHPPMPPPDIETLYQKFAR